MDGTVLTDAAVVVDGAKVFAVGPVADLKARYSDAEHEHFDGCCLMPGLINAHTHLELTLFPTQFFAQEDPGRLGMPKAKSGFVDWVCGVIEYKKSVPMQTLADAIGEGVERSLRSGTTCVGEISTVEGEFSILEKLKIRSVIFPEMISFDPEKAQDLFESMQALIERYVDQKENPEGLMSVGLSPHAPYTVSRSLLKIIQQYARMDHLPVQIHAAESFQEMEFFFDACGEIADKLFPYVKWGQFKPPTVRKTPVAYLDSIDFLKCEPALVHGVQVSDDDIEKIKQSGSKVIFCPRSNYFLQVGKAPVLRYLKRGIPVGLGTDSLASNTSLSMWDEMRFLHEQCAKDGVTSQNILAITTLGNAKVLGIDRMVGSLQPGKFADLLAVRLKNGIQQKPTAEGVCDELLMHTHDPDIRLVMVAGESVHRAKS